ncbi:MAG: short-chain fatty acid transporter [Myxococcales bacterium]|nr:short-chain fatty acid transporter [Myxococcales bacterium]
MLERLGASADRLVRRVMPDPFVLVLALTALTWAASVAMLARYGAPVSAGAPAPLALTAAVVSASEMLFKGFSDLLTFAMQMVLIVVTGETIASSPPVAKAIRRAAMIPKTQGGALWFVSTAALALGWLHWGFGLMTAAMLAREVARTCRERGVRVHYPLLGTAAYMSMLLWHAGTSASAPLLINTPGHFLSAQIGVIPLSQTVFTPVNVGLCALLLLLIPWVVRAMAPSDPAMIREVEPEPTAVADAPAARDRAPGEDAATGQESTARTIAERLDAFRGWQLAVSAVGLVALGHYVWTKGALAINHNVLNFAFVIVGMALYRTPVAYAKAISQSVRGTAGVVLQFPFYGAIMVMMRDSGLGHAIAGVFIAFASARTLPFYTFLASLVTKLFVPSGGGEWAVEGPVMLEAARRLGTPYGATTMGVAYGNMAGNMFQPFWALPLLGLLGLRAKDIMGYSLVVFLVAAPLLGIALLLPW